jgi:hypothetical protein
MNDKPTSASITHGFYQIFKGFENINGDPYLYVLCPMGENMGEDLRAVFLLKLGSALCDLENKVMEMSDEEIKNEIEQSKRFHVKTTEL